MPLGTLQDVPRPAGPPGDARHLHVLIGSASGSLAREIAVHLRASGFSVAHRTVSTSDDLADALRPELDAIYWSERIAGTSFADAVDLTHALAPGVPFFVIAGAHDDTRMVQALRRGAWDVIPEDRLARVGESTRAALHERDLRHAAQTSEHALKASEERFRALVENSADMVSLVDRDGTVIYRSPAAERILGYPPEELVGHHLLELIHPDDAPAARKMLDDLLAEPDVRLTACVRYRRRDGGWCWLEGIGSNMTERPGVQAIVLNCRDVTAEVTARKALQTTQLRYSAIFDGVAQGIFVADVESRVRIANLPFAQMLGYADAPALLARVRHIDRDVLVDPLQWQRCRASLAHGDDRHYAECELRRSDGSRFWGGITARMYLGPETEEPLLVVTVRDITERLAALRALQESEDRARRLLAVSPDALLLHKQGRIVWLNDTAVRLFGLDSAQQAIGRDQLDYVAPEFHREIDARRRQLLATGHVASSMEEDVLRPDGTRIPVEAVATRLVDGGEEAVLVILRDISERRDQARRIARLSHIRAMLTSSSAVVLRARSREELLREVCRIAVDEGAFAVGWVGRREHAGQALSVITRCRRGEGSMEDFPDDAAADALAPDIAARALAQGKAVVVDEPDLLAHAGMAHVRDFGLRSAVAIPFAEGPRPGALVLYADRRGAFDDEEVDLLEQVAAELSHALEGLERDEQLDFIAYHDPLTGLANRELFLDRLDQLCTLTGERTPAAVLYTDIDRFRIINECFGRQGGDELLVGIARRLREAFPTHATIARVASNGFAIVFTGFASAAEVGHLLEDVQARHLTAPFDVTGHQVGITLRMGIALHPGDGITADMLLRNAEAAWKDTKLRGERYLFYAPEMNSRVADLLALEDGLRRALEQQEFVIHYQPRVSLVNGDITGVEALLRWDHPQSGLMPPARFIPALEHSGLIHEVGRWLFAEATRQWHSWQAEGMIAPRIAINVSPAQLKQRDFVREVAAVLGPAGPAQPRIDIEITENLFMGELQETVQKLKELRALGVQIAVDDFGTGYSSLSYLARLPIDVVKVDKAFTADLTQSDSGLPVVATIIQLAQSLGLRVVAEGVENLEQARFLRLLRCDEVQGFLIARPMPAEALAQLLRDPARRARLASALRGAPT